MLTRRERRGIDRNIRPDQPTHATQAAEHCSSIGPAPCAAIAKPVTWSPHRKHERRPSEHILPSNSGKGFIATTTSKTSRRMPVT
eukprot:9482913-Pyramimonas_sp.AAC.1